MKTMWDERYQSNVYQYGINPNDFFAEQIAQLPVGRILIPAAGEGRDAVYAAKLGWEVYAFDLSDQGQAKAMKLAREEKVHLEYICADALQVQFPIESFDLIMSTYFHTPPEMRAKVHAQFVKWLKPGATLLIEGFNKRQIAHTSGGPKNIEWLFDTSTLASDFNALAIQLNQEIKRTLNEGPLHQGLAEVIQFKAKKTLST
jgi:2-polyprenyl-3-methyl-5-hydroxy-6-metoxy-1,4-benzoquinol methylase